MIVARIALVGLALTSGALAQPLPDAAMVQPEVAPGSAVAPLAVMDAGMPRFVQVQGARGTLDVADAGMPQTSTTSGLAAFDVAGVRPAIYDTDIATGSVLPLRRR